MLYGDKTRLFFYLRLIAQICLFNITRPRRSHEVGAQLPAIQRTWKGEKGEDEQFRWSREKRGHWSHCSELSTKLFSTLSCFSAGKIKHFAFLVNQKHWAVLCRSSLAITARKKKYLCFSKYNNRLGEDVISAAFFQITGGRRKEKKKLTSCYCFHVIHYWASCHLYSSWRNISLNTLFSPLMEQAELRHLLRNNKKRLIKK